MEKEPFEQDHDTRYDKIVFSINRFVEIKEKLSAAADLAYEELISEAAGQRSETRFSGCFEAQEAAMKHSYNCLKQRLNDLANSQGGVSLNQISNAIDYSIMDIAPFKKITNEFREEMQRNLTKILEGRQK